MLLTKIEEQKKNKNRVSVFADGEYLGSLDKLVCAQAGLKPGMEIDTERWEELQHSHEARVAFDKALDILANRGYTRQELRKKLQEKGFEESAVEKTLLRLEEYHYIDDETYARAFVADRAKLKGYGRARIAAELNRKGIDKNIREEALESYTAEDELAAAKKAVSALEKRHQREEDPRKRRSKIIAALQRQGFRWDIIEEAITDDSWEELE